jgi:hypothetical protein
MLDGAIVASPSHFKYITHSKPPYIRPDDQDYLLDGLREAGWQR